MIEFPPAPNWYSCAGKVEGSRFCYASQNSLVVLGLSDEKASVECILKGHKKRVEDVDLCSDQVASIIGKHMAASCSLDKSVRLWNLESESIIATNKHHGCPVQSLSMSSFPRGNQLDLLSGDSQGLLVLWSFPEDISRPILKQKISTSAIRCVRFCPKSSHRRLAVVGLQNGGVLLVDTSNLNVVQRFQGHSKEVLFCQWDPDTPRFLTTSSDGTVKCWSVDETDCLFTFSPPSPKKRQRNPEKWISACWNKDSILVGDASGLIHSYDISSGKFSTFKKFHNRTIFSISTSFCPAKAVAFSKDRTVSMWDIKSQNILWSLSCIGGFVYAIVPSPSKGMYALACGDSLRMWNTNKKRLGQMLQTIWKGIQSRVVCMDWHPEFNHVLLCGCEDGKVIVVDTLKDCVQKTICLHAESVSQVKWVIRGKVELIYSLDAKGDLWESIYQFKSKAAASQSPFSHSHVNLKELNKITITSFAFSSDCEISFLGYSNGYVSVKYSSEKCPILLTNHTCTISKVSFSKNDSFVACSSQDGFFSIYSVNDNSVTFLGKNVLKQSPITDLSWGPMVEESSSDMYLATCSQTGSISVWNSVTFECISTYSAHSESALCVTWGFNGELISGGEDQAVRNICLNSKPCGEITPEGISENDEKIPHPLKKKRKTTLLSESSHSESFGIDKLLSLQKSELTGVHSIIFTNKFPSMDDIQTIKNGGDLDRPAYVDLWYGNTPGALKEVVSSGKASPFWAAISALDGEDTWKAMCRIMAKKYVQDKQYNNAVGMFIAVGDIRAAISCFSDAEMFQEAVCLARLRHSPHDPNLQPILEEVYLKWAIHAEINKEFALSCQCFIAVGKYSRAIDTLLRARTLESISAALEVAMGFPENKESTTCKTKTFLLWCWYQVCSSKWSNISKCIQKSEQYSSFPGIVRFFQKSKQLWEALGDNKKLSLSLPISEEIESLEPLVNEVYMIVSELQNDPNCILLNSFVHFSYLYCKHPENSSQSFQRFKMLLISNSEFSVFAKNLDYVMEKEFLEKAHLIKK